MNFPVTFPNLGKANYIDANPCIGKARLMNEQVKNTDDPVKADYFLDITNEVCPMTFVKTKLKLEQLAKGEVLEVRLQGKEPLENVPRSAAEQGDTILSLDAEDDGAQPDGIHRLFIRRDQ